MAARVAKTASVRTPLNQIGLYNGGAKRDRTADLLNAIQALSQLSYGPTYKTN